MDRSAQAVAELGEGGIGLLAHEGEQALAAWLIHLGGRPAGVGEGGEGAGLAAALQQASDPGGADAEEGGDGGAAEAALIAGVDDPLAEVLGVGLHGSVPFLLHSTQPATRGCEAL